jgi:hypothetical protein
LYGYEGCDFLKGFGFLQRGDFTAEDDQDIVNGAFFRPWFHRRHHVFSLDQKLFYPSEQFPSRGDRRGVNAPDRLVQGSIKGSGGQTDAAWILGARQVGQTAFCQIESHFQPASLVGIQAQSPLLGRLLQAKKGITRSQGIGLGKKKPNAQGQGEQYIDQKERRQKLFHLSPIRTTDSVCTTSVTVFLVQLCRLQCNLWFKSLCASRQSVLNFLSPRVLGHG